MQQLTLELTPPPPPTLENFVPGRNAEVLAALRALLEGRAGERFVYLWGGRGCGKSHLAAGFLAAAAALGLTTGQVRAGDEALSPAELARRGAVAVEDVGRLNDAQQIALFDLINRMQEGTALLLVTGSVPPMRLRLRPELATRLAQGLIYQVHCLSDEDKAQALMAHARERGFTLGGDVAAYLLRTWQRDLPSLMGLLEVLDRYSLQVKRPITLPLVREVLALLAHETPASASRER